MDTDKHNRCVHLSSLVVFPGVCITTDYLSPPNVIVLFNIGYIKLDQRSTESNWEIMMTNQTKRYDLHWLCIASLPALQGWHKCI